MTISFKSEEGTGPRAPIGVRGVRRPAEHAHVVKDDAEAIAIAQRLAKEFSIGASDRDHNRIWPIKELDAFSQSGLWSINVPKKFGGPEVSYVTLAKIIEIISAADPSLGQIPQNHLGIVAAIRTSSDQAQHKLLFAEILHGVRFGNAFSEYGSKSAADFETKFTDAGDHVVVNGRKFYSSGALLAHLVPIVALDAEGRPWYAIVDRNAPGLTVIDDWSSFGQKTTLSGTVFLENVKVPKTHLVPSYKGYGRPTADGAIFQIIHVAIDVGIARAAIDDTITFVRESSRAWVDSGLEHAWQDPYTIQAVGDLKLRLHAAQALLDSAGPAVDRAVANPTAETVAEAQIAVAESKVLGTEVAIAATNSARPSRSTISIGIGAMPGLIRSMIRSAGNTLFSAIIFSMASIHLCTPGSDLSVGDATLRVAVGSGQGTGSRREGARLFDVRRTIDLPESKSADQRCSGEVADDGAAASAIAGADKGVLRDQ